VKPTEGLKALLDEFGFPAGSDNSLKFLTFLGLLQKWNTRINLTASTEWEFLKPFFWEGMWAAGFYPEWAKRHLDIGSGAGFPGIPLAILASNTKVEMVESRAKRAFFLENVVRELGLIHSKIYQDRLQEMLKKNQEKKWDCFSWKAIKLSAGDLEQLFGRDNSKSQFWMFHGKELAVEDPGVMEKGFTILKKELFPGRKEWKLSIFKKVPSSQFPVPS
jgi:16S rRNA (guanine(527)-N(7))-methyltransferase RsmG